MSEPEPRRSVRSTKGQHNQRAADPLDQPLEPKRRGSKKSNKRQADPEPEPEEEEEEVIRCVCGATSQDTVDPEDPEDPWIACDFCHVWQHNVCVGMSVFDEDLENIEYFCEECKPEAHKELLDGRAKGKKVWEIRRQAFMADKAAEKQKKKTPAKKGKKGKTEIPEDARASHAKSSASPAPAPEKKSKSAAVKRKDRHDSADTTTKEPSKLRKVSGNLAQPSHPDYEPPADLPDTITELPEARQGPAKLLHKSLQYSIAHQDNNSKIPNDGVSNETRAVRLAIAIERAVHDHSQHEYIKQCRSLGSNLKSNLDLTSRLLTGTLTPPMLAVMSSDELQTDKMQEETAAAKERSVRQSVIGIDDTQGPRVRKTHKGDELVDDGSEMAPIPQRQGSKTGSSSRAQQSHSRKPSGDVQPAPASNFDIKKVMDGVNKSPTVAHRRRPSGPAPSQAPIEDADVDRLLEDDDPASPPYSPAEEELDPDVVWRGQLIMPATADFKVNAKHIAGANLLKTLDIPYNALLPDRLIVGGRIAMSSATEYLCSLRWSSVMDLVTVSLEPAREEGKHDFNQLFDYFMSRERWAVVGDKRHANVKDTYLVPVPAGTGNQPEFLLNLEDNYFPVTRTENTLLLVIVYRNDDLTLRKIHGAGEAGGTATGAQMTDGSPNPAPNNGVQRAMSAAGPGYSPTTPHVGNGGFGPPQAGQRYNQAPQPGAPLTNEQAQAQAQMEGEAMARSILGPFASAATLVYLMPHAHQMSSTEWQIIRRVLEQEPRARDDLQYLGVLISRESEADSYQQQPATQQGQHPAQQSPNAAGTPGYQGPQAQPPQQQYAGATSQTAGVSPVPTSGTPSQLPPRQTPISLPPIPGMPASVHQSYHLAQAERQARDVQSPASTVPSSTAPTV